LRSISWRATASRRWGSTRPNIHTSVEAIKLADRDTYLGDMDLPAATGAELPL
jgi:hypothetical protein